MREKGEPPQGQTEKEMTEIVMIKENKKVKGHWSMFLSLNCNGSWNLQPLLLENINETRWQSTQLPSQVGPGMIVTYCKHWLLC